MTVKNVHIKVKKLIKMLLFWHFFFFVRETLNCFFLANVCKLESLACCWNGRNVSPKKQIIIQSEQESYQHLKPQSSRFERERENLENPLKVISIPNHSTFFLRRYFMGFFFGTPLVHNNSFYGTARAIIQIEDFYILRRSTYATKNYGFLDSKKKK